MEGTQLVKVVSHQLQLLLVTWMKIDQAILGMIIIIAEVAVFITSILTQAMVCLVVIKVIKVSVTVREHLPTQTNNKIHHEEKTGRTQMPYSQKEQLTN